MWRFILIIAMVVAPPAWAQTIDWPGLLKEAEQAARQASDEKARNYLLVDIAVAYVAGNIDGAERLIEETRQSDGKCADAVAVALTFMRGANPPICRANGPATIHSLNDMTSSEIQVPSADLVAKLEQGEFAGAFRGYPAYATRQERRYFIAFIAQWLVVRNRSDGIAAIAALPTDDITKDDFHRLVAWHAGRFGKFALARQVLAAIQSKTERFAAGADLATHLLLSGRRGESGELFRQGRDQLMPEERMRAFLGGTSLVEQGQYVGWFDNYAPRPFLDMVGVTPRFGPVTFLALAQIGVGDWDGLRQTLRFVDEIVTQADLDVEDYPWQATTSYLALAHLLAANNFRADRAVTQLRRWIDTNSIERLRNERRALVDWVDAWEIAQTRAERKESLVETLQLIATTPQIVQAAIILRALNADWKATLTELKAVAIDPRRRLSVLGALSFFRPDDASFPSIMAFMLGVIDAPNLRDYVELDRMVLRAVDNGVDQLQLSATGRETFFARYRRELTSILIRFDDIEIGRAHV